MATITRVTNRSLASTLLPPHKRLSGLKAGEALTRLDACRIASDGLVYKASGAAANANARVRGFADDDTAIGEAVTLLNDGLVAYGSGMTPGEDLYLSATAGQLDDAATTGGTVPIAFVFNATTLMLLPLR